jgi:hypothetical protein
LKIIINLLGIPLTTTRKTSTGALEGWKGEGLIILSLKSSIECPFMIAFPSRDTL